MNTCNHFPVTEIVDAAFNTSNDAKFKCRQFRKAVCSISFLYYGLELWHSAKEHVRYSLLLVTICPCNFSPVAKLAAECSTFYIVVKFADYYKKSKQWWKMERNAVSRHLCEQ